MSVSKARCLPALVGACLKLVVGTGAFVAGATAQTSPAASDPVVEQHIDHIVTALAPAVLVADETAKTTKLSARMAELHVPGVSIAFIQNGRIAWARGFGVIRVGGAQVTPNTLFQAASISKPVAAMAVLHLVQSGKIDLDTDVNRYLKSWKLPENSYTATEKVTLRHLLAHTGGVSVQGFDGYVRGEAVPSLRQVLDGEKPANSRPVRVDTTPGTIWRYSGGGYAVLQQLVGDVTGAPFRAVMRDSVLKPIGMVHSGYDQPLPRRRIAQTAFPNDAKGALIPGGARTYPQLAAAGLWSTPSDLARYVIELQNALAGKPARVLSQAMAREMVKPGGLGGWGLGIGVGGRPGRSYFTHRGSNEGFRCLLVGYEDGDGLVVMTNGDQGGQIAAELLRTVALEYGWPDFQPKRHVVTAADVKGFDSYIGRYQLGAGGVVTVTRDGAHLFAQIMDQETVDEFFPEGPSAFFSKTIDAEITFQVGPDGRATALTLRRDERDVSASRIP